LAVQDVPTLPMLSDRQWVWQPGEGMGLKITFEGDATLSGASFLDSSAALLVQEDPNRVYPRGHYLPDPLAVIEVRGKEVSILFNAYQAGTPIANKLQAVIKKYEGTQNN
jgi:hypothetical protein